MFCQNALQQQAFLIRIKCKCSRHQEVSGDFTSGSTPSAYVQPMEFIPDGITHISQRHKQCLRPRLAQ